MTGTHVFRVRVSLPSAILRLALAGIAVFGVLALNPIPLWRGVGVVAALIGALVPRSLGAWAAAACMPLGLMLADPAPVRTALAVLLVHAVHILACISLTVPLGSRIALRALVPTAVRFVVIQAIAQPLALGAAVVAGAASGVEISWLAPLGAALLLIGVGFSLRGLRSADAKG